MTRFHFWYDPLCLAACALYGLNRWLLKPLCGSAFLHSHFNDLLVIPAALPIVLWIQRKLGVRRTDSFPTGGEIVFHLLVWSLLVELIGPRVMPNAIGDALDVLAYAAGGLVAWIWWNQAGTAHVEAA